VTFELLTSKSYQFVFVPNGTEAVKLLEIRQAVYITLTNF